VRGLDESWALKVEREGKDAGSLAAAGLFVGGGASDPEGHQAFFVPAVRAHGGKACSPGQDGGGSRVEGIAGPSLNSVPKAIHAFKGPGVGGDEVG